MRQALFILLALGTLACAESQAQTPTLKNNSVYLGKAAAASFCSKNKSGNAFPFGCDLIRKVTELSGGDSEVILPPERVLRAGVKVNVRQTLPETVGSQLIYSCKVGVLRPGDEITIDGIVRYNLARDSYFFGLVSGEPKKDCIFDEPNLPVTSAPK